MGEVDHISFPLHLHCSYLRPLWSAAKQATRGRTAGRTPRASSEGMEEQRVRIRTREARLDALKESVSTKASVN